MGIYLVSVDAECWALDEEEGGLAETAAALDEELAAAGLGPCTAPVEGPSVRGSGTSFEEKLYRPMQSFQQLCEDLLDEEDQEALLGWDLLIPQALEDFVDLPVPSSYSELTTVCGAHRTLAAARHLAEAIGLPPQVPEYCDNLEIGVWFDEHAEQTAATHPGRWADDFDAAFYAAMYLRAAEHCLRRNAPLVYA